MISGGIDAAISERNQARFFTEISEEIRARVPVQIAEGSTERISEKKLVRILGRVY